MVCVYCWLRGGGRDGLVEDEAVRAGERLPVRWVDGAGATVAVLLAAARSAGEGQWTYEVSGILSCRPGPKEVLLDDTLSSESLLSFAFSCD